MRADGIVMENDLVNGLKALQVLRKRRDAAEPLQLDIVVLSLGFYHEVVTDGQPFFSLLMEAIRALADDGVAVVVAAGNDATMRPMFPAAFADVENPPAVPVLSVGALNPDRSVALFSNSARWVRYWAPGVSIISTFPAALNGGLNASVETADPTLPNVKRRTVDSDNNGSFCTWSGTSFAAPLVAGLLAAWIVENGDVAAEGPARVEMMNEGIGGIDVLRSP